MRYWEKLPHSASYHLCIYKSIVYVVIPESSSGITEDSCVRYLEPRLTVGVAGVESIMIAVLEILIVSSI